MVSLWDIPTVCKPLNTTDNIRPILEEQAGYLESGTNGKVQADFCEIEAIPADLIGPSRTFSIASPSKAEGDDGKGVFDANDLYKTQCYGFDISNDFYRFRIFEMNLSPLYPVSMFFDEGVLEDSEEMLSKQSIKRGKLSNQYIICSDQDFIASLSAAFTSKKVRYIIGKLLKL